MTSNSLSKPSFKDYLEKYRLLVLHPGAFFDELSPAEPERQEGQQKEQEGQEDGQQEEHEDWQEWLKQREEQKGPKEQEVPEVQEEQAQPPLKQSLLLLIPPAFVCSLGLWLITSNPMMSCIRGIGGIAGLALWAFIEKYTIRFLSHNVSYRQIFYLVAWAGQAMVLAWIPYVGEPMFMIISGFWCYKAFKHSLKIQEGAALTAVGGPVILICLTAVTLAFVFLWIASLTTVFMNKS